ncbi:MAG: ribosome maturation factor RimM [candidate division Zixibacteria bacterium]|nr:ribosome maturation factor RimM [candidate division Zixibacteria bacterium]
MTRIRGLKGELVIVPLSEKTERFSQLREVYLTKAESGRYAIVSVRKHQNKILMMLEGIDTPEKAQMLVGSLVEMPVEQLPNLAQDEYYWHDLVGLEVFGQDGRFIGRVDKILANPGNDILSVSENEKLYYVPATKMAVKAVDLQKRSITVDQNFIVSQ